MSSSECTSLLVSATKRANHRRYMERNGVKYINPTQEAQAEWKKKINHLSDISLFPTVKST